MTNQVSVKEKTVRAYLPERLRTNTTIGNPVKAIALEHPALSAGALCSILVMVAIFTNAIWFQTQKHPAPLFSTRSVPANLEAPVKTASVKPAKTTPEARPAVTDEASKELLREIQTALSVRGYYDGKLDGVYGSRTRKAIDGFQTDTGLEVDGEPSVRLLTHILMSPSSRPVEVPVPKTIAASSQKVKVTTVKLETVQTPEMTSGIVAKIQSGLKAYGYEDLKVDGKMGQQTATAIQRFQLDYGMKITGEPSSKVLEKLQEIGALNQG